MCKRQVFDLTAMDDAGRVAFFETCETEVCVSYAVPIRSALGIAAMAAAAVAALPAAAQAQEVTVAAASAELIDGDEVIVVTAGGIARANVKFVDERDEPADKDIPELPVIVETPAVAPAKRN